MERETQHSGKTIGHPNTQYAEGYPQDKFPHSYLYTPFMQKYKSSPAVLELFLKGIDEQTHLEEFKEKVKLATHSQIKAILQSLERTIKSTKDSCFDKSQAVKQLVMGIEAGDLYFINQACTTAIPCLKKIVKNADPGEEKNLLYWMVVGVIEYWGRKFSQDKTKSFCKNYNELKEQGVEFPLGIEERLREQLWVCRQLVQELEDLWKTDDVNKIECKLRELKGFENNELRNCPYPTIVDYLKEISKIIQKCNDNYAEWRNILPSQDWHSLLFEEEPIPKTAIYKDSDRNSMSDLVKSFSSAPDLSEPTLQPTTDEGSEFVYLIERIVDLEDLVQMYKKDLLRMQDSYIRMTEEKEETLAKCNSLTDTNKTLKKERDKSQRIQRKKSKNKLQAIRVKLESEVFQCQLDIESLEKDNLDLQQNLNRMIGRSREHSPQQDALLNQTDSPKSFQGIDDLYLKFGENYSDSSLEATEER